MNTKRSVLNETSWWISYIFFFGLFAAVLGLIGMAQGTYFITCLVRDPAHTSNWCIVAILVGFLSSIITVMGLWIIYRLAEKDVVPVPKMRK